MENTPWAVVKIALILAVLEGVGLWWFLSWHYRSLIEAKDAVIEAKNAVIDAKKEQEDSQKRSQDEVIEAKNSALEAVEARAKSLKEIVEDNRIQLHQTPATNRYESMSTVRLVTKAKELAGKLREEEKAYRARSWQITEAHQDAMSKATTNEELQKTSRDMGNKFIELYGEQQAKWDRDYKSEAVLLREEMLARVSKETREKIRGMGGLYAMGSQLSMTADDLEMLAGMLSKEPVEP